MLLKTTQNLDTWDVKSCCCSCLPSLKSQDLTVLSRPPVQSLVPSLEMSIQLAPSVWPWNCLIKQTRLNNDFLPELKVNTVVLLVLDSVCVSSSLHQPMCSQQQSCPPPHPIVKYAHCTQAILQVPKNMKCTTNRLNEN